MSEEAKTIIGTNSRISIAVLALIMGPLIWILSVLSQINADIAGLRNEFKYVRDSSWTIADMERYRFKVQLDNASIGVKAPDVQEIVRQRPK